MTDTANTVTVPRVAAMWGALEGIGGQTPSSSLESVVPARAHSPLSEWVTRPPPDSLKRHMSLSLAELITKSMEPVELEFPSESHVMRRKRLNEASYQSERQSGVLTVSDLAGDCSLEKEGWAHT